MWGSVVTEVPMTDLKPREEEDRSRPPLQPLSRIFSLFLSLSLPFSRTESGTTGRRKLDMESSISGNTPLLFGLLRLCPTLELLWTPCFWIKPPLLAGRCRGRISLMKSFIHCASSPPWASQIYNNIICGPQHVPSDEIILNALQICYY